jgi:N-acetylmuramoyl-L-alanine amidase
MPRAMISAKRMRWISWLRILAVVFLLQSKLAFGADCTSKAAEAIVIVLDVGHVARQPGKRCQRSLPCSWGETSARGVPEYDFNIKLAERIKEELVRAGFYSTQVMVTQIEGSSGLSQRADRANKLNADIFLSIHHDGVRDEYLTPWLYQREQNYFFDDPKGFSLHVSPKNIRYQESLRFARILADQLMGSGLHFTTIHEPSNPAGARVPYLDSKRGIYRRDGLVVLSKTEMPAVLLEAGVIVNRDEELIVSTPAYRGTIAAAIAKTVAQFCKPGEASTYRVVNVAPNDVLNIRSGPDANLSIVSTIPPNARGVRIVGACTGQWCQIDYRGARGWVNRRFLASD